MTVYIFGKDRRVRIALGTGEAVDLIHDENNYQITISVSASHKVQNGEYVGFRCVDGHFRLFCITNSALDDDKSVTDVTATDAIVQDMKEVIIENKQVLDVSLIEALEEYIPDETWVISGEQPMDRLEKSRAYYTTLWTMIKTLEQLYEWKVEGYYLFDGGTITGKALHMRSGEPVFRGRIFQSGRDASKVYIARNGRPITRLYGLGKATGTDDEPQNVTFADVEWSTDKGDPVNKPKGQTWVEDPNAVAIDGAHADIFSVQDVENPEELLNRTWEELQRRKRPSVSINATVADMEMVKGYEHMQIRLGDLVAVCLKDETIVEAKIIGIKRHYFRPWLTTITIGEKKATITSQVTNLITNATHTFERLTIYKNRFQEDEALIQLNAEHIQLNAATIIEHAEQILLKAEQADMEAALLLIDGINERLILQAKEIEAKADRILLNGYVKAEDFESETLKVLEVARIADLKTLNFSCSGTARIELIYADGAVITNLNAPNAIIGGEAATWKRQTVLTGIGTINQSKRQLTLMTADGGTATLDIVTDVSISPNSAAINYLGG